jgi:hypothetical protein
MWLSCLSIPFSLLPLRLVEVADHSLNAWQHQQIDRRQCAHTLNGSSWTEPMQRLSDKPILFRPTSQLSIQSPRKTHPPQAPLRLSKISTTRNAQSMTVRHGALSGGMMTGGLCTLSTLFTVSAATVQTRNPILSPPAHIGS